MKTCETSRFYGFKSYSSSIWKCIELFHKHVLVPGAVMVALNQSSYFESGLSLNVEIRVKTVNKRSYSHEAHKLTRVWTDPIYRLIPLNTVTTKRCLRQLTSVSRADLSSAVRELERLSSWPSLMLLCRSTLRPVLHSHSSFVSQAVQFIGPWICLSLISFAFERYYQVIIWWNLGWRNISMMKAVAVSTAVSLRAVAWYARGFIIADTFSDFIFHIL